MTYDEISLSISKILIRPSLNSDNYLFNNQILMFNYLIILIINKKVLSPAPFLLKLAPFCDHKNLPRKEKHQITSRSQKCLNSSNIFKSTSGKNLKGRFYHHFPMQILFRAATFVEVGGARPDKILTRRVADASH